MLLIPLLAMWLSCAIGCRQQVPAALFNLLMPLPSRRAFCKTSMSPPQDLHPGEPIQTR